MIVIDYVFGVLNCVWAIMRFFVWVNFLPMERYLEWSGWVSSRYDWFGFNYDEEVLQLYYL
jgi:hypothetical protein